MKVYQVMKLFSKCELKEIQFLKQVKANIRNKKNFKNKNELN